MTSPAVQTTGLVSGNGTSLAQAFTLNGCTAGNTLILAFIHENNGFNGVTFTVADSQGQTVLQDVLINRANTYTVGILRVAAINAGTHTVTITYSSGVAANSVFRGAMSEYASIGAVDQTGSAQNAGSTGPVSATSGAPLSQAVELAVSVALNESGRTGFGAPAGWNAIATSTVAIVADFVTSATTAVTANFGTLSSSGAWDIVVATYPLIVSTRTRTLLGVGT